MLELLVILMGTGIILWTLVEGTRKNLTLAVTGDEDMKIVEGSFTRPSGKEELSEAEAVAKAYMEQKSAGNVEKARALGRQYADTLRMESTDLLGLEKERKATEGEGNLPFAKETSDQLLRAHHRTVLFSYAVNRAIADLSPNSILAQTALNVFYDDLESKDPALAAHVRDMAAFSLYILCDRSENCLEDEIGNIYARLCGGEGQPELVEEGDSCFRRYYELCAHLHQQTQYVTL